MDTRTIMIFPEFHNMDVIHFYRKQYDPLSALVKPHITLVFPFQSNMSNDRLNKHLSDKLMNIKPFEITLNGVTKQPGELGNYLFLNIIEGKEHIHEIHELLYSGLLKEYKKGYPYTPHLTLGNLDSLEKLEMAYLDASKCNETFKAVINTISVEVIGASGESMIISEHRLPE
ncbi:2'-5' RNA ligase family protein [Lacrimispora sphenoides]|uniref:2'-5' RNA ligase superfamily protein n=1 Tax=Lacrimispora sphenoides JCM 1415 TaxID=1297793 RepID=A0ABY1CIZ9_9FIRM|nr:2'-5' RNA ligase family protein [Lacrimispora sphenoides]SEU08200.1 2'-5' RNA ligase superfamily protein [[Clostridium] sphenoides JCM 1415]SUY49326.1 2'-5' RNA ligase superfamily [Lacrimispora sphenoides]